jgi:hypothetical protein
MLFYYVFYIGKKTKKKQIKIKAMKKLLILAGLLVFTACKDKDVKKESGNNYEYCSAYTTLELPNTKPELLYVEKEDGVITLWRQIDGRIVKYKEVHNFHPLDSNAVKIMLDYIKSTHPVVLELKERLRERLEQDRVAYELNIKNLKN